MVMRPEGLLCTGCNEVLYGPIPPEDLFDHATKPWGGRLKLDEKPARQLSPEEEETLRKTRKLIQGMFGNFKLCDIQPLLPSKPSGLIFALKPRYKNKKNGVPTPDKPLFQEIDPSQPIVIKLNRPEADL